MTNRLTSRLTRLLARLGRLLRSRYAYRLGVVLTLAAVLGIVDYERYLAGSNLPLGAYPVLSLNEHRRLLVIAPHCDDEALGAAGLIQAALRMGIEVKVVIATNGDGYLFATMEEFRQAFPRPQDFINMGELRREESLHAMSILGLSPAAVTFLGYPDRGLSAMWWSNWENTRPYRSPYSQRDHSPYMHIRRPGVPYSGESLLQDLCEILDEFRPDLIVLPHPLDEHPDHRALSAFTALAVELTRAGDPEYNPTLLGYLVHYGMYPQHRRLAPLDDGLRPPRQLNVVGEWVQWLLSSGDMAAKQRSVAAYKSQQRLLGAFLRRFVQPNELFMRVESATALEVVGVDMTTYAQTHRPVGSQEFLRADDPVRDNTVRTVNKGADIAGLHVFRLGDDIWVVLELRGTVSRAYSYSLFVRTFWADHSTAWQMNLARLDTETVWAKGKQVWFKLDRDILGNPEWLAVAAETRQRILFDRTGWHLIRLGRWPWEVSDRGE